MAQIFAELLFGMKPWVPISTKAIEPVQISGKAAIGYIAGLYSIKILFSQRLRSYSSKE